MWVLPGFHSPSIRGSSSHNYDRSASVPVYTHERASGAIKVGGGAGLAVTMAELRRRLWSNPLMLFGHAMADEGSMRDISAKQIFDIIRFVLPHAFLLHARIYIRI